jgi:signal transduction histidine kinase
MEDCSEAIASDVAAVGRMDVVPVLLRIICDTTGMRFSAVARVTAGSWTACAVEDGLDFGLTPGGQLDLRTTLCKESREVRAPVVIDHASADPRYREHHTPRTYGIESYISVPIVLPSGEYFGNLCAIDSRPAKVSDPRVIGMFTGFATLIGAQLAKDRANEQQQRALASERAERELREQFIAILGHDLRGPLTGVLAGAEYLQLPNAGLTPRAIAVAKRIGSSARRMSRLIDDILDFAKGRLGGGFELRLSDVHDVAEALREVVAEHQLAQPDRQLVVNIDAGHPVHCDRGRLQQLVSNLLANALIHGSTTEPISLSATIDDTSVTVTVTNQGEPIPEASLASIFTPFWRSSTSTSRRGLGLGLFICDQIAKAHGGSLEVISSKSTGTIFAARLPIHARPAGPSVSRARGVAPSTVDEASRSER